MLGDLILKASTIITMDPGRPRVEAVAVDTTTGKIVAIGTLADCQAVARPELLRLISATPS